MLKKDIACERLNGLDVIKVTVSEGKEQPYYIRTNGMCERGCFIRIGSSAPHDAGADRLYLLSQNAYVVEEYPFAESTFGVYATAYLLRRQKAGFEQFFCK